MGVYKLSANSVKNGRTIYGSMLAGNTAFFPTSFESIATTTVGAGGSANVEFTSIPSTYAHLQIRIFGRSNRTSVVDAVNVRFNGDTGFNYAEHWLYGDGTSALAYGSGGMSLMSTARIAGDSAGSNVFGSIIIDVLDYTNTNKFTTIRSLGGTDNNGSGEVDFISGLWRNTNAVTSITLYPGTSTNWKQYSHVALYGIKGVA